MNTENNQETPLIENHLAQMQGWDAPLNYSHIEKKFSFKTTIKPLLLLMH